MSISKGLSALVLLTATTAGYSCDGIWQTATAGNWSTGFQPCTPNVSGDSATFGTPPTGPVAVNIDTMPNITSINFQNFNSYILSGNNLGLQGTTSSIHVSQGTHFINSEVDLTNTILTLAVEAEGTLNPTYINDTSNASSIVFSGPGVINFTHSDPSVANTGVVIGDKANFENHTIVNLSNSALVTGPGMGGLALGAALALNHGDLTMNSGVFTMNNTGDVIGTGPATLGVFCYLNSGNFVQNGGTINVLNSGTVIDTIGISQTGGSVFVVAVGSATINGGTFFIKNTAAVAAANNFTASAAITALSDLQINGGQLINDGSVLCNSAMGAGPGTITVGPAAVLAGDGLFVSRNFMGGFFDITINNSGKLIPGDPVTAGTMTVLGTVNQSPIATFQANIINGDKYGQLNATNVNLAGSLGVFGLPGFKISPRDTFKIVVSPDAISGTFSSVSMLNNSSYIPMVFYSPSEVVLVLNAGSYPGMQQSIFSSVNHANIRNEREMQHLRSRLTHEEEEVAVASVKGPSKNKLAAILGSQMQMRREQQRLSQNIGSCDQKPWNVYVGPIGSLGDVRTSKHQIGFSEWSAGALAGFDYAGDQFGVGFVAEYERLHGDVRNHWGHFNIDEAHASLYATFVPQCTNRLAINGIVGGGYEWINTKRNTGFSGSSVAHGTPRAGEFDALFGLEYTIPVDKAGGRPSNLTFTPLVNLQYIYLNFDGYREHHANIFNLKVSGFKPQSLRSTLGAWINNFWEWTDLRLDAELDVAWQREYLDHGNHLHFSTPNFAAPSGSMSTVGAGRNTYLAGIDLLFTLYDTYGVEGSYDFEWNTLFRDHAFYVGFNVKF